MAKGLKKYEKTQEKICFRQSKKSLDAWDEEKPQQLGKGLFDLNQWLKQICNSWYKLKCYLTNIFETSLTKQNIDCRAPLSSHNKVAKT